MATLTALADPIDALWLTEINFIECEEGTLEDPRYNCAGPGTNTLGIVNDYDTAESGEALSNIVGPEFENVSAVSVGFTGEGSAPAISAYAYTADGFRISSSAFGMQRYTFLEDGVLNISASLTYSFSGETESEKYLNPRGWLDGGITAFQMDDDQFDPDDCNLFGLIAGADISSPDALTALLFCLIWHDRYWWDETIGIIPIDFAGLENLENHELLPASSPIANGEKVIDFSIEGQAGDVWFLTTDLYMPAHNAGWADSSNTLFVDLQNPELVEASFPYETFTVAPSPAEIVINELCPCDHATDGESWKNHGKYVSCVAHISEDLAGAGLLTVMEKDAIVSEASVSSCGRKK
jgi:hypothetical protein